MPYASSNIRFLPCFRFTCLTIKGFSVFFILRDVQVCHTLYDGHNLPFKKINSNFLRVLITPPINEPHFQNIPIPSMVALNVSTQSKIIALGIVEGQLSTHFMITVFCDLILTNV